MTATRFPDRVTAGRCLGAMLGHLADRDVIVLGLPRGGVPVAAEVAGLLSAELDVLVVRKLGLPQQPELAMGAIAGIAGDVELVRNEALIHQVGVPDEVLAEVYRRESAELQRREADYRGGRPSAQVAGRTVVLVDDGLATGATMRAAVAALHHHHPAEIVAAAPVASANACRSLSAEVTEVVCACIPESFRAVGDAYLDFRPTSDAEVRAVLVRAGVAGE